MSLHLNLPAFNCKECDFIYFPYKENHPCPKCGHVPNQSPEGYTELIDGITRSLKINKRQGDTFIPMAWSTTSFCDQVQYMVAIAFEVLETEDNIDEESRIDRFLLEKVKGYSDETKKHFKEIIIDVRSYYKLDPYVPAAEEPPRWSTLREKILKIIK